MEQWRGALKEFQHNYNQRRPHEALGMQRPAERYRPSERGYQAQPRAWEYPQGSEVRRLNSQGFLYWKGQNWYVCEGLVGRGVRVGKHAPRALNTHRHN